MGLPRHTSDITGHNQAVNVMADNDKPETVRRLESWKEIAAFFGRDERTVHRWEKDLGLPVHRLPGTKGRVYAFSQELASWSTKPKHAVVEDVPEVVAVLDVPAARPSHPRLIFVVATGVVLAVLAFAVPLIKSRWHGADRNREAEDLYLKGRYNWSKRTPENLNLAVDFFTQAIVRQPNYALAYVGLADSYNLLREYSAMPDSEAYPRAFAAAQRAVQLDDSLAEAHNSLAFILFWWKWDARRADQEYRRAIDLNPDYAVAHHWHATFLYEVNRLPEALAEIERAQKLDSASTSILADKALILFDSGRTGEGLSLLKQVKGSDPTFLSSDRYLAYMYLAQSDYPNYIRELEETAARSKTSQDKALAVAARKGWNARGAPGMFEEIHTVQKELHDQGINNAYWLACTAARLGNKKEAVQYLEAAFEKREGEFVALLLQSDFRSLYGEPGFENLKARYEKVLWGSAVH